MSSPDVQNLGTSDIATAWQAQVTDSEKLGSLKSLFESKERSVESFINARESFREAFMSEIGQVAGSLPEGAVGPFLDKAYAALDKILSGTFGKTEQSIVDSGGQYTKKAHREMVKEANTLAIEAFKSIGESRLSDQDVISQARTETHSRGQMGGTVKPQLFITDEGRINMLRSAPSLETLVFRGGGARGIGNAAALTELELTGSLQNVKHVVGTSAGALTAISLACGHDAARFSKLVDDHPMQTISQGVENFSQKYPMVELSGVAGKDHFLGKFLQGKGGGSGERALQLCDQATASRVSDYLQSSWNTESFQTKLAEIRNNMPDGEAIVQRLAMLKETPNFDTDRTGKMITFKDLRILSHLAPDTFKDLTLTGVDKTNKTTHYFNVEKYPDMPIAIAGRISMSIPGFFQCVKFDPGDGKGVRSWVDGAVGSNMPSEVVFKGLKGKELETAQAKTMLFTYAERDKFKDKLYGDGQFNSTLEIAKRYGQNAVGSFIGNSQWGNSSANDSKKVYQGGLNTFVVHHYDIGLTDLRASDLRVQMAKGQATLMALKQIENRQGGGFAQEFDSVEDAVTYLTPTEKQMILQDGPPDPGSYQDGFDDQRYQMEKKLYDLVSNGA